MTSSQPKLIAITANTSWYLYNFRSNLIKALLADGYHVMAIAPQDAYSERLTALSDNVSFQHIDIDQGGTNPVKDFVTTVAFHRIYRKRRPDVVLNFTPKNNIYSTLAASRFKIPVINNIAGLGSVFIEEGLVARIARWLYHISQKHAAHIFFQNEEDRELFLSAGFVDPAIAERLPGSGVDLARFKLTPLPDDGSRRFLLVARMLYEKGVEEYAMAAKSLREKYPHVECRVVGILDANNPSAIPREVIEDWHDAKYINFRGATDSIEDEIAQVHCMVLPSYYREGVPRSLLEGAAMGRPIITTDNVGCRETVIDGVSGFLCEKRSGESLLRAMMRITEMEVNELRAIGVAGGELMKISFGEERIIQSYANVVRRCH